MIVITTAATRKNKTLNWIVEEMCVWKGDNQERVSNTADKLYM